MKKLMILLAAALMMSGASMAQDNQRRERRQFNPEDMVKRQTEQMVEALDLDADQATAVLKLNADRMKELSGMRRFGQRNRAEGEEQERPTEEQMKAMREKMETSQKAYNDEMKKILTEEQYAKYEKMQNQFRGRGGMRGNRGQFGHGRGEFRGNRERNAE